MEKEKIIIYAAFLVLLTALACFLFSAACEPFWESYFISARNGESGDTLCFRWCYDVKGVRTSMFNFTGKDEYGFYSYECQCDLRDCGNPLGVFGHLFSGD